MSMVLNLVDQGDQIRICRKLCLFKNNTPTPVSSRDLVPNEYTQTWDVETKWESIKLRSSFRIWTISFEHFNKGVIIT